MKKSTLKQKEAIEFCEHWLYITFEGNIESFDDCSYFLSIYLDDAKQTKMELSAEYNSYIWDIE